MSTQDVKRKADDVYDDIYSVIDTEGFQRALRAADRAAALGLDIPGGPDDLEERVAKRRTKKSTKAKGNGKKAQQSRGRSPSPSVSEHEEVPRLTEAQKSVSDLVVCARMFVNKRNPDIKDLKTAIKDLLFSNDMDVPWDFLGTPEQG